MIGAGNWVYTFWTQGALKVPLLIWPILGFGLILNALWWTSGLVHRATNQPWSMNLTGVGAAITALGIMWSLGAIGFGVLGLAIGAVVFEVIMAGYVLKTSLRITADTLKACVLRGLSCCLLNQLKILPPSMKSKFYPEQSTATTEN